MDQKNKFYKNKPVYGIDGIPAYLKESLKNQCRIWCIISFFCFVYGG